MNEELLSSKEELRLKRWRQLLGDGDADGTGYQLVGVDAEIDSTISKLYDGGLSKDPNRKGTLAASTPYLTQWLGDIRKFFPATVVRVMQQDALDRFNLKQLLFEPELLSAAEPNVHLVATLIALKNLIPEKTHATARIVVGKVVDELIKKITGPLRNALTGAFNRSSRNNHPKHNEINWNRTIRANLKHYQASYKTIIPERRIGHFRKSSSLRDIILLVDQSGSMSTSVVYAGIYGAVLASLPSVTTKFIVFDTAVVDLTETLHDPIELLFSVQLGGGTDINKALAYCQGLITRPQDTIIILISDLNEGGNKDAMMRRALSISASGAQMIAILALADNGAPAFDHDTAERFACFGIPSFACTPDLFADMLAEAIAKNDVAQWAASRDIIIVAPL